MQPVSLFGAYNTIHIISFVLAKHILILPLKQMIAVSELFHIK